MSLRSTVDQLAALARLEDDWDSYGSPALSAIAVADAAKILVAVREQLASRAGERAVPYHVAPMPGGGVHLEWIGPAAAIELYVYADGRLDTLVAEPSGDDETYRKQQDITTSDAVEIIASVVAPIVAGA